MPQFVIGRAGWGAWYIGDQLGASRVDVTRLQTLGSCFRTPVSVSRTTGTDREWLTIHLPQTTEEALDTR